MRLSRGKGDQSEADSGWLDGDTLSSCLLFLPAANCGGRGTDDDRGPADYVLTDDGTLRDGWR